MSDPLTYWWGVTLCPPELNDVALAESVVIAVRSAAALEMTTNSEVQKHPWSQSLSSMDSEWNARWNRRLIRTLRHTIVTPRIGEVGGRK